MLWEAVEGSFVHGMPEAIPSFVDVVGCFGRQLFHGSPAPILLFNLYLENAFLWVYELLPISHISSVQELSGLGNCTGLRFHKYLQDPRLHFIIQPFWRNAYVCLQGLRNFLRNHHPFLSQGLSATVLIHKHSLTHPGLKTAVIDGG